MKTAITLTLCLALAACGGGKRDPRGVDRDETLLSVSATGQSQTVPDEARFSAGVSSIAANAREATRMYNEVMAKVTAALTALGVEKKDLQTQRLTVNRIDYGKNKGKFEASNVVEVTMRSVTRVGEAVAATTEAGANVLSGPDLRISDREAANQSAYAAAYKAARARAEAYAGAADLKIARVLAIRDGGSSGGMPAPYPVAVSADAMAIEEAAAPFNPGTQTDTVAVRVDFALEAK